MKKHYLIWALVIGLVVWFFVLPQLGKMQGAGGSGSAG